MDINPVAFVLMAVLIAALIVLSVFGRSINTVFFYIEQKNTCVQAGVLSCKTTGKLPNGWDSRNQKGESCRTLCKDMQRKGNGTQCGDYGW